MMKTCILVLDNIRSVENTGSIFRTSDGLGVDKVYLAGTTPAPLDRFGRKRPDFSKVALGAEEFVVWERCVDSVDLIEKLKSEGYTILALEQDIRSIPLESFNTHAMENMVLVVGNEVGGVSPEVLERADVILEIQMKGRKESLNVSVSTGIALHSLLTQLP